MQGYHEHIDRHAHVIERLVRLEENVAGFSGNKRVSET